MKPNPFRWMRTALQFVRNGRVVPQSVVKAGAEAVVTQSRFGIMDAALKVQQGGDVGAFYAALKEQVKLAHMANAALARGGFDNMTPRDWQRVTDKVASEFEFARGFVEDVARGRYGKPGGELSQGVLSRATQYAEASRSTYENEYREANKEAGRTQAMRVLAAADHCPGCVAAAGEWMDIDDVLPIGDAECRHNCHCTLIFR